jgi:NAD(P)-dependent dehydrogenase (short-subunit alcohol dehydrogenase family)
LLRHDALRGRVVSAGGAIAAACAGAGATLALPGAGRIDVLVVDAADAFGDGGLGGLRAALDGASARVLDVASAQWLPTNDTARGATLVLVAPDLAAGQHAAAAAAALENLARTLAVEWARLGVRASVVVPGPRAAEDDLAALVAFLASPAGDYFSGCRFDVR